MWKIREISIFEFKPENPARRMISDSLSYLTRYQEFKVYHLSKRDITIVNVKHEAEKWYGWWSITICMTGTNFEQTNIFPWLPTLTSYTPEMVSLLRQFVSSGLSTEFRCSYSSDGSFIFYQRSLHILSSESLHIYICTCLRDQYTIQTSCFFASTQAMLIIRHIYGRPSREDWVDVICLSDPILDDTGKDI